MRSWKLLGNWKLLVGLAAVITIGLWGTGIIGSRATSSSTHTSAHLPTSPSAGVKSTSAANVNTAVQPKGQPEFKAMFTGSSLNTSAWATCYPWATGTTGCTNFGNREYQWYLPDEDHVSNGNLVLAAHRAPTAGTDKKGRYKEYGCRSGMITSYPSLRFKYGYLQVVAKIPDKAGLWPGLWLAAANGVWPPEIDLLEAWGATGKYSEKSGVFFHPAPAGTPQVIGHVSKSLSVGWHTFSLLWTSNQLSWYIDNHLILKVTQRVPHQKMYFVADLAEFAKPAAGNCNGSLIIHSIKIWHL